MLKCPFLSTNSKDVKCFEDCPLENWKETGNMCPFKNLSECEDANKKDSTN